MKITNLNFTFIDQNKPLFKDVDLVFSQSKLTVLCGANGAGKSTFFKLLSGQLQGIITANFELNGTSFRAQNNKLPTELTEQVRLVHQDVDTMLALNLTAFENLQLARIHNYPSLNALPSINVTAIAQYLPFDLATPVHMLSGGQRQLLAIAMMLQHQPKVVLLDEPTAALDAENTRTVLTMLQNLAHATETYVIIICHNPELIEQYADECIAISG